MLSDVQLRTLKTPGKHFDGGGLYLEVTPAGGRYWRLKYRHCGKERRLAFGVYPEVSLKAARERLTQRLDAAPAPDGWAATQVRLAFHVAEADAWKWRGNKKGKKKPPTTSSHPLLRAPLLRANDATGLSLEALIGQQLTRAHVAVVSRGGSFLDPVRRVWWPRADEDQLARRLSLVLQDVSADLHLADKVRARPKFADLVAPLESAWREPVPVSYTHLTLPTSDLV